MVGAFRIVHKLRTPSTAPSPAGTTPKSIVLFSTAGIGDVLSDTPAIRAVKETFPSAYITVVVHHKRFDLLAANPWIDCLIPHRKNVFTFFSTMLRIRECRPDVAIVLRANDPDIWPLAYLSGARAVVSRPESTLFSFLVNTPVFIPEWPDLPGVIQTLKIVRHIGADTKEPLIVYRVRDDERSAMSRRLQTWNTSGKMPVAVQIHHSPRLSFRDWPESSFVSLLQDILVEHPNVQIIMTGGPADQGKAKAILNGLSRRGIAVNIIDAVGILSLRETAALLEQSRMLITTDTGIMHLGFALKTPTLALLHPYNARRVGPHGYGQIHRSIVLSGPERDDRGILRPLSGIQPGDVFLLFNHMLQVSRT